MEKCHRGVAYYIISCRRPLTTVEKHGFKVMLRSFNPHYKPVSRRTQMNEGTKTNVEILMKTADYLALSTDIWTSTGNQSYISLTSTFLNDDWVLVTVTLACRYLTEDGIYINKVMLEILAEWDIDVKRIPDITSDNDEKTRVGIEMLGNAASETVRDALNASLRLAARLRRRSRAAGCGRSDICTLTESMCYLT